MKSSHQNKNREHCNAAFSPRLRSKKRRALRAALLMPENFTTKAQRHKDPDQESIVFLCVSVSLWFNGLVMPLSTKTNMLVLVCE